MCIYISAVTILLYYISANSDINCVTASDITLTKNNRQHRSAAAVKEYRAETLEQTGLFISLFILKL